MELSGTLFTYYDRLTGFESGLIDATKTVVFIGGIGEAFNALTYFIPLQERLETLGWSLTQVQLSSSGDGYGTSSLRQDSDELDALVKYLKEKRNKEKIVFLGHSTGCQDSYWHNKYGEMSGSVNGYILQAPVSDRMGLMRDPSCQKLLQQAKKMVNERKGEELMPRISGWAPITADRIVSLLDYRGDDDVFSPDLKDEDLIELYENVTRPICWVYSDQDECYAAMTDDPNEKQKVMERFQKFCPAIKIIDNVPFGDHCMTREDSQSHFIDTVERFLKLVDI